MSVDKTVPWAVPRREGINKERVVVQQLGGKWTPYRGPHGYLENVGLKGQLHGGHGQDVHSL